MNENQKYITNEYQERHRFWTDKTLTQFGFANNFFIVLAIGILGFVLKEIETDKKIYFTLVQIDWRITLARISALFAFASVFCGTITMLSRLFDLRLTRHINTVRISAYKKKNNYIKLEEKYISIDDKPLLPIFLETLTSKHYYIKDSEIKDSEILKCKFNTLRSRTLILGRFSWMFFYYQMIILILSVFTFMVALMK